MAKKREVIYIFTGTKAPQPKKKSRKGARIFAAIFALLLIVGTVLVGYCARIDGKWFTNGDPTTWRWGGIWTEDKDEGHAHVHTLSDKLKGATPTAAINPGGLDVLCPTCGGSCTIQNSSSATCTMNGQKNYKCNNCGKNVNRTINALGHNYKWVIANPTDSYTCTRCNDVSETRAHTHSYSWVVTVEPTQEAEGEESYKCDCGDISDTRTLPRLATPVELPEDPTKEGYTFIGWFFDEACTEAYDGRVIYEDTVLYAGWQINAFTVTFDSAGGSDVDAQTVDWNTAATLTTPERIGYVFQGWYLSDGTEYVDQSITEDVTLTAHWERVQCTVAFYVDGTLYTTLTVDYGTPLIKVAESIGLFVRNIISYSFIDGSEPAGELSEQKVTGDMSINADEPTTEDKIKGAVSRYWLPTASCVVDAIALMLIGWAIFGGKRR